jgi:molybdopterin molybdotransferase
MSKPGFHQLHSLQEAMNILYDIAPVPKNESVSLDRALGRILAEDLFAPLSIPSFAKSAMDGYAVLTQDLYSASLNNPIQLKVTGEIFPGIIPTQEVNSTQCMEISTGAPLPKGADGIVMVEYTEREGHIVRFFKASIPGEHIIKPGSDIQEGQVVLKKGTRLGPRHTALLSGLGIETITVFKHLTITISSSGNEIIRPPASLMEGQSYDINSRAIIDALREYGCDAKDYDIIPDEIDKMKIKLKEMAQHSDIIILSGGSSLGTKDLMLEALSEMGQIYVHGIAVKPGKPTLIGTIDGKLFLGLPGHPASALSNYYIIIKPLLDHMHQIYRQFKPMIQALLSVKVASTIGRFEYLPVRLEYQDSHYIAIPVMKGSSAISSLSLADGYLEINENIEVLDKGTAVSVVLF